VFVLFSIISIVLLTGHGANLIAGYNTAGREELTKIIAGYMSSENSAIFAETVNGE